MTRLSQLAVTASLVLGSLPALAQQADLAAKLNDEGKQLMYAQKYAEASAKFRDAVARVPEPKYFFNLCTSLFQEGKFGEAITACNAVEKNSPAPDLQAKTTKLIGRIELEAQQQGVALQPQGGGGGDPNLGEPDPNNPYPTPAGPDPSNPNPGPNGGQPQYQQAVGRPPSQGLFTGTTADNNYTWTLGVDLYGGGGKVGDGYGNATGGLRLKGDYMINPAARFGAQVYFQFTHFSKGEMQTGLADTLDIMDFGIAAYKHFCLPGTQRLCLTPLAGAQLAMMSPASDDDGFDNTQVFNYTALGARLEIGAHYAFGSRYEHVLGIALGTNAYTRVFSESMDALWPAERIGLDKGGAAGYLSVGYTYRFNTPLGSSPFVTLE